MRGEDEELKEKVRNEAREFQERNVEEKREKKDEIASNCSLGEDVTGEGLNANVNIFESACRV